MMCALALSSELAGGQVEEAKLIASDGMPFQLFGLSVSVSGDTAIIGAGWDDENGDQSGSAYVFRKVDGVWMQETKLLASDGQAQDYFGFAVSISGDTAVVGAREDDDNGSKSGSAFVFERLDGIWTQTAKLLASDGRAQDLFGYSVSISGDAVIVGALQDDDNGSNSGSSYIFEKVAGEWTQTAKLVASDGQAGDGFGLAVAIDGARVIVGAGFDDDNGDTSGSAYIFEHLGTTWTETAKLVASDGQALDIFGSSVSISNDTATVGAEGDSDNGLGAGSGYVFEKVDGAWSQTDKLLPSDGTAGSLFGISVAVSGDTLIAGASNRGTGSAYVFRKVADSWTQTAKLLASDGQSGDAFGRAVSIDGDTVLVGANDLGHDSGEAAYVFIILPPCEIDLNVDYRLDFFDLQLFLNYFAAGDLRADVIADGTLNFADVEAFLNAYAAGCP